MVLGLAAIFWGAMAMGFSGAIMPGPLLTVTLSETARRGFRVGPTLVLGHAIAELALLIGLVMGLQRLLQQTSVVAGIGILGGSFLLWMAYGMVSGAINGSVKLEGAGSHADGRSRPLVATGALTSIANPYWCAWWATIGLAYLASAMSFGYVGVAAFYLGHIMSDLIWYSSISFVISRGRGLLRPGIYRGVIVGCGLLMAGLGVGFLLNGAGTVLASFT